MGIIANAQELITMDRKDLANMALNNAQYALFNRAYFDEFVTIDGIFQHPEGYSFAQWLRYNHVPLTAYEDEPEDLYEE
jgi:hypothetical protein